MDAYRVYRQRIQPELCLQKDNQGWYLFLGQRNLSQSAVIIRAHGRHPPVITKKRHVQACRVVMYPRHGHCGHQPPIIRLKRARRSSTKWTGMVVIVMFAADIKVEPTKILLAYGQHALIHLDVGYKVTYRPTGRNQWFKIYCPKPGEIKHASCQPLQPTRPKVTQSGPKFKAAT